MPPTIRPPSKKMKGSRLSKSTKRAVKASTLGSKRKEKLRAELRSPGVSSREKALIKAMNKGGVGGKGLGDVLKSQQSRSRKRAATKRSFRPKGARY